jgi:hypothetical protein
MNKADKELARQAWTENDWEGHVDIPKLIQLVRADEREACAKVCEDLGMATNGMYERNHECAKAIRARGNT